MMIKSIKFYNYRNLDGRKFEFGNKVNVIVGENNSGKTNLLDGIRLAFSYITDDYVRVGIGDFKDSNDEKPICIEVELEKDAIASLNFLDQNGNRQCGFKVTISKTQGTRYHRAVTYLNGGPVDFDALSNDLRLPNVSIIPFIRAEDIHAAGLITNLSNFLDSEDKYRDLKRNYIDAAKRDMGDRKAKFQEFCKKFDQVLDVAFSEPRMYDEKVYIVEEGGKAHNYKVGSGYKSIANIILNAINDRFNIVLIDELENHLHPALLRTLIREMKDMRNVIFIATTHSPVVVNSLKMEELYSTTGVNFSKISEENRKKLNAFLHPGRGELILATNVVLVEGYSEELLFRWYIDEHNYNWTVVNVGGVMFEPYIELAKLLKKKIVVISDNDRAISKNGEPSSRYKNLKSLCEQKGIKLIEVDNTLETDLYNNGYLNNYMRLMTTHENHQDIYVARDRKKIEIVEKLIEDNVELSNWHVIKGVFDEFKSH